MRVQPRHAILAALVLATFWPVELSAQLGNLGGRIRRRVENQVARKIDTVIGEAVACALGDTKCVEDAKAKGEPVVITDKEGKVITDEKGHPVSDQAQAAARADAPGDGVWRNYDFVPGHTVWFASDFSQERVGRFPASQLEFVRGNAQIVELNNEKVLEVSESSVFRVKLPGELPEGFSVEFYVSIPAPNLSTNLFFSPLTSSVSRHDSHYLSVYSASGIFKGGTSTSSMQTGGVVKAMTPVKFQADGDYAIMYVDAERAGNVPNVTLIRSDTLEFHVTANARFRAYLKGIIVAVGIDPLYDTLMKNGEITTRGILFDVDSDRLRPESTPVLTELVEMLQSHADLRVMVEGHTDSTGDDAHNMSLSDRRARAVVDYLATKGIDRGRAASSGKGESAPVAGNDTAKGREQNRRVVIRRVTG
jgi:outer membrane protein OmpA-like peptidoglycan-associated protein